MEGLTALGGADPVMGTLALKQERVAQEVGTAMLDKALDVQKQLAAGILRSLGLGANLDVQA